MSPASALTIVIPCYDEAHRLAPSLRRVLSWIDGQDAIVDVLVVDDGSRDATADVARDALRGRPHRVLQHAANRGKGAALRTGMTAAQGDVVLFTDADLSTPIEEADRFLEAHRAGHAVVIGTRKTAGAVVTRHQHPVRENMGRVYSALSRALICPGVTDFTCGFKSFTRDAAHALFARLCEDGWAYDSELMLVARRLGYEIHEIPVPWANDPSTRVNLVRDSIGSAAGLARIRWRAFRGVYDRSAYS